MTRHLTFSFALLILAGCASVQRPDAVLYGVNTKAKKLRGYNLKDYDDDGNRKASAKVAERPLSELGDAWICTDPKGFANIKVFVSDLRNELKRKCQ